MKTMRSDPRRGSEAGRGFGDSNDLPMRSERARIVESRQRGPDGHGLLTRREWNAGTTITLDEHRRRVARS